MIDIALSVLALVAGGLPLELYAPAGAPLGYQDEKGLPPGLAASLHAEDRPAEQPT
jgi:hypothetical protein